MKEARLKVNLSKKIFFKLMNNSFYGKLMENIRKRMNLDLLPKEDIMKKIKRQSKVTFNGKVADYESFKLFSFNKESIVYTKPIYDGFTILDLSKLFMYEFYYEKLFNYWGENVKLHYMDTDYFVLTIKTDDLVKDLHHFRDDFPFSNLNRDQEFSLKSK